MKTIKNRIKGTINDTNRTGSLIGIFTIVGIFLLSVLLTSCEKHINNDSPQMVTQTLHLDNIIKEYDLKKSFDPNTWNYVYDPGSYNITLSNAENTYTKSVTIDQLLNGSVSVDMLTGVYNITYSTPHIFDAGYNQAIEDHIDISINNTDIQIEGSPIPLLGVYTDKMIVVDLPNTSSVKFYFSNPDGITNFASDPNSYFMNGVYYCYTNKQPHKIEINFSDGTERIMLYSDVFPDWVNGKIYHLTSPMSGALELDLPDWQKESIII